MKAERYIPKKLQHAIFFATSSCWRNPSSTWTPRSLPRGFDASISKKLGHISIIIFFMLSLSTGIASDVDSIKTSTQTLTTLQTLRAQGQLDQALRLGQTYLNTHPQDSDVLLLMGLMYYQKKDFVTAESYLHHALTVSPAYLDVKLGLIRVYIAQNKMDLAAHLLKEVANTAATNPEVQALQKMMMRIQPPPPPVASTTPSPLSKIQALRKKHALQEAIRLAKQYLQTNPKDSDVLLQLGLIYYEQKHNALAEHYLKQALNLSPHYRDVQVALFRNDVVMEKYQHATHMLHLIGPETPDDPKLLELKRFLQKAQNAKELKKIDRALQQNNLDPAKQLIQKELSLHPNDPDFMNQEAELFLNLHQYAMAAEVDKEILKKDPGNTLAKQSLKLLSSISPYALYGPNEIGLHTEIDYVDFLDATWQYTSLYYARDGEEGKMVVGMNNTSRFGHNASQATLNLFPILNRHMYLNIEGGYAQQPILFPTAYGGGEAFFAGDLAEVSGGFRYSSILAPSIAYTQYTGSISKEWKDYWVCFRPTYYTPQNGGSSLLYTTTLVKFFDTRDMFAKVVVGAGTSPNLADLLTVDFLVVKNTFVTGGIQFPFLNHKLLVNIGGDYQHWVFPNSTVWNISGIVLGFNFRFEDNQK